MRVATVLALLLTSLMAEIGWARTACIPSAFQSTAPRGISLVGHSGTPDPMGAVTYVIRDAIGNPYPGSVVALNFANCSDVRFATDVAAPGTLVDCSRRAIYGVADQLGSVTFRIVGSGSGASPTS